MGGLRAQSAAATLLQQGQDAMSRGDYAAAAQAFETIVTTYPSTQGIEDITLRAGFAYLHADDDLKAIDILAKLTTPATLPEFRGKALFYTGMAQFSQGHKQTVPAQGNEWYPKAESTMETLLAHINQNPTADNRQLIEDAMYYQALAAFGQNKDETAEHDLDNLLARFPGSLQKPDYLLLLGSIHAVQAGDSVNAKQADAARAAAQKAIASFDLVVNDPNALVQANEANMRKAETLYLIAQLDPNDGGGFEKALEIFRLVHRKDDMIALQQKRIDQLRNVQAAALQNGGVGGVNTRLLDRETARLAELQAGPDAIVQALIRMAESYVAMKKPDEARTLLNRLRVVTLSPAQQQEVDFQYLFSYTLGGQEQKATAALHDYLARHPGDPQADSISVQISAALMKNGNYDGALAQAKESLADFPNGKHDSEAVEMESEALTKLNRLAEAKTVIDDFLQKNPGSPAAFGLLVTQGEGLAQKGDLAGALTSFAKVKDNPAAGDFEAAADAYYINTLNQLQRFPEVVKESQAFATKFPKSKAAASVAVIGAMAMDKAGDPHAVAALQDAAKKFSDDTQIAPFALYYVTAIYQRECAQPAKFPHALADLTAAVKNLASSFPTAYPLISQANDGLSTLLQKEKKFDDAAGLYQPLLNATDTSVAAGAQDKIGDIRLAQAKAMGSYQSLQTEPERDEAQKRLQAAQDAYAVTLKNFPDELGGVGDAFQGLVNVGEQRVHWGLMPESGLEDFLAKATAGLTSPEMPARVELAKAGLVFVVKNGRDQYSAALARFDKVVAANPSLALTGLEADHYGELLIAAGRYPDALKVYDNLLASAKPTDSPALAQGYYGLAATYLKQGDYPNAKTWFQKMQALPGNAAWSPNVTEMNLGLAEIKAQSDSPADLAAAKAAFAAIMVSPTAGAENQAKALLGYGAILEKSGHAVKAPGQNDVEFATHYYEQVNLFYGPATPELSAQGLYLAAQAHAKAGDATGAAKDYAVLRTTYAKTAPDWAAKAPAP